MLYKIRDGIKKQQSQAAEDQEAFIFDKLKSEVWAICRYEFVTCCLVALGCGYKDISKA